MGREEEGFYKREGPLPREGRRDTTQEGARGSPTGQRFQGESRKKIRKDLGRTRTVAKGRRDLFLRKILQVDWGRRGTNFEKLLRGFDSPIVTQCKGNKG